MLCLWLKPHLRLWKKPLERHLINPRKAVVPAMLFGLALAGCNRHSDPGGEDAKGSAAVPEVTVAKVERASLAQNLIVSGNLTALPNHDAKVAALVPGRIAKVLVVEGDHVKEGETLAEIDNTLLKEQERQAEAAVAQAKANADNSQRTAEREDGLLGRGISSRKEVEDAHTQLAVNTAALSQAQAGLATAKAQVERSIVRAPFAGVVVKRFIAVGEQVDGTAAQPVAEVAQLETLELMGTVPASRLNEIRAGEAFPFSTSAVADVQFAAKVVSILPAVDPATNNGTVRIRIENAKRLLKLGQFLSVELPLKQKGSRLVVPRQAVYPDESGEPHVYKVTNDDAESIPVKLGIQAGDKTEILEGLKEGETVIVTGGYGLPEKSKVRVKQ
jgi:RND family efflux transporter MFP subunit